MPELPEVEITRRHLAESVVGRVLGRPILGGHRTFRRNERPGDVSDRLVDRTVRRVERRGKFIVAVLDEDWRWLIHLGMSGRLQISDPVGAVAPHTHFRVEVSGGVVTEVRFVDPRTFGFVAALSPEETVEMMASVGRDALDDLPEAEALAEHFARHTVPVKAVLLDQRFVAGLGNIYADEVLFRAGIHPARPAASLTSGEVEKLRSSIRPVLEAGIAHGGTSLADLAYLLPDGRAGEYLSRLEVYGRRGLACGRCGNVIDRLMIAQRSTHYCPECQK